jgi:hypothetical protein
MEDPETRRAYRRVIIPSSKNPCHDLALAHHPGLSHLLAFPGIGEEFTNTSLVSVSLTFKDGLGDGFVRYHANGR